MEELLQSMSAEGGKLIANWGPKVLGALATLIIGTWIIRMLMRGIERMLGTRHVDETLRPFIRTLILFGLYTMLFITVAGMVGIETTSFIAILGAAGLAIGLALQGSLQNFAGGVMILLFRPFKVGDLIESGEGLGFVKEISVFVTFLETFQNKTVIVPNSVLASNTVTNYSSKGNIRADIPFAIRYDADADKAAEIVLNVLRNSDKVLQTPAPSVYVTDLGENAVKMVALPFTTVEDYWDVFWGLRGEIKKALGAAGYEAALPQRIVTMKNA
jgi:small conductance mechanosensitive channel